MAKYDIKIEGEGDVGSVEAADEASAVAAAEGFIAGGDYDLSDGETTTVRYWLTREGDEQGDSRKLVLEG